jgi:hypothetical protein
MRTIEVADRPDVVAKKDDGRDVDGVVPSGVSAETPAPEPSIDLDAATEPSIDAADREAVGVDLINARCERRAFVAVPGDVSAETPLGLSIEAVDPAALVDPPLAERWRPRAVDARVSAGTRASGPSIEAADPAALVDPPLAECRRPPTVDARVSAETPAFGPSIEAADPGALVDPPLAECRTPPAVDARVSAETATFGLPIVVAWPRAEREDFAEVPGVGSPRMRATSATSRCGSSRITEPVGHASTQAGAA